MLIKQQIDNLNKLKDHKLYDSKLKELKQSLRELADQINREFYKYETLSPTAYLKNIEIIADYLTEIR